MRAINTGNSYHIYDNSVRLFNGLPPQVYKIAFDSMKGYSLEAYDAISVDEKVYGKHAEKVEKTLSTFKTVARSLGVILSGDKGIGKSLFAKMLCARATREGYPVLIVSEAFPDIADFIDSIDQEMLVLFDEFDKTFPIHKSNDDDGAQASLLSLFDGVSQHKKLFVVTCNDIYSLSDYMINRPGRFHYHIRFEYPSEQEINAYLTDNLPPEKHFLIGDVVNFSRMVQLNYDCLRAIAFELCRCDSFSDAISDLNIVNTNNTYGDVSLIFSDGVRYVNSRELIDLFSSDRDCMEFGLGDHRVGRDYIEVEFVGSEAVFENDLGGFFLPKEKLTLKDRFEYECKVMNDIPKAFASAHRAEDVAGILIKPRFEDGTIHYFKKKKR